MAPPSGSNSIAWVRPMYRLAFRPSVYPGNFFQMPHTAADVNAHHYFRPYGSVESLSWCAPSIYLLATGKIAGTNAAAAQACISYLRTRPPAQTLYDVKWRWGN